jgi:hypothetical protein
VGSGHRCPWGKNVATAVEHATAVLPTRRTVRVLPCRGGGYTLDACCAAAVDARRDVGTPQLPAARDKDARVMGSMARRPVSLQNGNVD